MLKAIRTRGFTMVEIIIVISVIGILSGLVMTGYVAYIKNAKNAQTASSISSYKTAVNSMKFEHQLVPDDYTLDFGRLHSCISTTSPTAVCCFLYYVLGSAPYYGCGDNATFNNFDARFGSGPAPTGFPVGYNTTQLSSWIRQYLPANPQPLPYNSSIPDCTASITLYGASLPCTARQIGLEVDIASDNSATLYLHYMLPVDTDCQSSNVVTPTDTPPGIPYGFYQPIGVSYTGAKYSARYTGSGPAKYTFCVVGIR